MSTTGFSVLPDSTASTSLEWLAATTAEASTTLVLPQMDYSPFLLNSFNPIKNPNSLQAQQLFATMSKEEEQAAVIEMVQVITVTVTAALEETATLNEMVVTSSKLSSLPALIELSTIHEVSIPVSIPVSPVGVLSANNLLPAPVEIPPQSITSSAVSSPRIDIEVFATTSDIVLVTDTNSPPTPRPLLSIPPPNASTNINFLQSEPTASALSEKTSNDNKTTISPLTIIGMATGASIAVFVSITLIVIYLIRSKQLKKARRSSRSSSDAGSDSSRTSRPKMKWPMLRQKSWCEEKRMPTQHQCGNFIRYSVPCEQKGMKCGFPNSEEELAALRVQLGHRRGRSISSMNLVQQLPYPQRHPPPPKGPPLGPPPPRPPRPAPLSLSEIPGPLTLPPVVTKRTAPKPRLESKQVTWQDQLFQDQSFVHLPQIHKLCHIRALPSIASEVESGEISKDHKRPVEPPRADSRSCLIGSKTPESVHEIPSSPIYRSYCASVSTLAIEGVNRPYSALSTSSRAVSPISHTIALSPPPAHHQCASPGLQSPNYGFLRRSQLASSVYNSILLDPNSLHQKQLSRQNTYAGKSVAGRSRYHKRSLSDDRTSSNRHVSIINGSFSTESYLPLGPMSPCLHWGHRTPTESRAYDSRAYHADAESNSNSASFAHTPSSAMFESENEQLLCSSKPGSKLNCTQAPRAAVGKQKWDQNPGLKDHAASHHPSCKPNSSAANNEQIKGLNILLLPPLTTSLPRAQTSKNNSTDSHITPLTENHPLNLSCPSIGITATAHSPNGPHGNKLVARSPHSVVGRETDSAPSVSSTGSSILFLDEANLGTITDPGDVEMRQPMGAEKDRVCISSLGHRHFQATGDGDGESSDQVQPHRDHLKQDEKRACTDAGFEVRYDSEAPQTPKASASNTFRFPNFSNCTSECPADIKFHASQPTASPAPKTNPSTSKLTLPPQNREALTPGPGRSQLSSNTTLPSALSLCIDTFTYTTSSSRCSTHFDTGTSSEEDSFRLMKDLERVSIMEASKSPAPIETIACGNTVGEEKTRDNRDTSCTAMLNSPPQAFKFASILKPKLEKDGQPIKERSEGEEEKVAGCVIDFDRGMCRTVYSPTLSIVNFYGGPAYESLNDLGPDSQKEDTIVESGKGDDEERQKEQKAHDI